MSFQVPERLADMLSPTSLAALTEALAPPPARRAAVDFEVELEAGREGTFVLRYAQGTVSAKKGFAKAPLISVRVDAAALPLVREELQAAVDGFPQAPILAARLVSLKGLEAKVASEVLAGIKRLKEAHCLHLIVVGDGKVSVARGPVDEATHELTVQVDGAAARSLLRGADPATLSTSMRGDRGVATATLSALGPVVAILGLTP